jgi:signal transduction histidine kinase
MKKKKRNSSELNRRYSLISVGTVLLCVAIFALVQAVLMEDIFLFATKFDMSTAAEAIEKIDFSKKGYEKILADIEGDDNLYIEIYRPRDTLIYTTNSNLAIFDEKGEVQIDTDGLKPRIMKILQRIEYSGDNYYEIRQEYFATARYLVYSHFSDEDMSLELYYPYELIEDNAEIASTVTFYLCLMIIVMLITLSIHIGFMVFAPLRNMITQTRKMANLDFTAKCPPYKINDLNELSASINSLSRSLSIALEKLQSENRQLETDIRYERKQEKVRRSFISNVSHELKTPISIIRGYAEGMKMGIGCESTEEFCDIIIDESDKMNALIIRLMEYMKLSSGAYKLYSTEFNLAEVLAECAEGLSGRIEEKEIEYICHINTDFVAYSDALMVQNIFTNYLSNAISHIDFDKIIRVTATDVGTAYRIRVFNTGKPIPGTDIENIWQSFYRADKSHSREEGRFGLGLSFVATIQEMTGEKYGVENKKDGVEFWFDVKKKV